MAQAVRPAEQVTLIEIDIGFHADNGLVLGFHSFEQDHRAGLVDERGQIRQRAAHHAIARGSGRDRTVEFHDIGLQRPDAVEVRMAGAEIVDGDQATERAQRLDDLLQQHLIADAAFDDLDHDAVRRHAVTPHDAAKIATALDVAHDLVGADIEEHPAIVGRLLREVADMQSLTQPFELLRIGSAGRVGIKKLHRRNRCIVGIHGAQQGFVTDGLWMGETEDRLERTLQPQIAVGRGEAAVVVTGELGMGTCRACIGYVCCLRHMTSSPRATRAHYRCFGPKVNRLKKLHGAQLRA